MALWQERIKQLEELRKAGGGSGAQFTEARATLNATQAELAERSGVSLSTLKLLEREGKGSLQRLAKIAVVLDLDGELRRLFSEPSQYESIASVERTSRQRAPSSRKP